ncbi:PorV/PorQ family protein, partial [candidate division WOR-3 bacterium]|nr:PorV/PorQ family protein [candidate division WOR-3 bacterium]MBD3364418.1 PorV/PorQ family protein [candidate division WOR-3 bacterium]
GQTSLNHLRIQPSARSQGMGGVSLGIADNPQALFGNPAGLEAGERHVLAANYLPYPAGIHIGSFLFKPKTATDLRYSVGAFYLNSGQMTLTSPTNEDLGTFGYHVVNLCGTAAYAFTEKLSAGGNLRFHLASADSNTQIAAAADLGLMYADIIPGLTAGLVVKDIAFEIIPFVEEPGAIPLGIGGGLSYAGIDNLLVGIDVTKPLDAPLLVSGGIEFLPVDFLALRAGYSTAGNAWKMGKGSDILAGFSLGLGIRDLVGTSVDYAITPGLDLGLFHRISISYSF